MRIAMSALAASVALLAAVPAAAQGRGPSKVPPGHLPPAGMCRVWYDNLPPGRQPAPTSCSAARRQAASSGGRVIYGGDRDGRRDRDGRYDRDECRVILGRVVCRDDDDRRRDDRRDDECYDRDRDGWCDWAEGRRDGDRTRACVDRNRDGWCDDSRGRTRRVAAMPVMYRLSALQRGYRDATYAQWLGNLWTSPTWTDANRDGVADRIVWRARNGQTVQIWEDTNRDGRADRVRIYDNGRLVADHR